MTATFEISLLDDDGETLATNIVKRKLPDSTTDEEAQSLGEAILRDRVRLDWYVKAED